TMPVHIEVAPAAENVFAYEAARIGIGERLLHDFGKIAVLASDVDVAYGRPDGQSSDDHAFDHRMRIMLEDEPVFASSRFTLVAIAKNVLGLGGLLGNKRPFQAGVKSCATASAQP